MLTPLTTFRRAASKARDNLERAGGQDNFIDATAELLPDSLFKDDSEESDQREEVISGDEDEHGGDHQPLIGKARLNLKSSSERQLDHSFQSHNFASVSTAQTTQIPAHPEDSSFKDQKRRNVEEHVAYGIFFILGACILLAWNCEIVATSYFRARLGGSRFESSFTSWVALSFTTGNLCFLAWANAIQQGANLPRRIVWSIFILAIVIFLFVASTRVKTIDADLFFIFLMVSTIALAASASFLQNAIVALSSLFGPTYLQGIMSGQGAVGVVVAAIQFASALAVVRPTTTATVLYSHPVPWENQLRNLYIQGVGLSGQEVVLRLDDQSASLDAARDSAFSFFLTIGCFSFLSFLAHLLLLKLPIYKRVSKAQSAEEIDRSEAATKRVGPTIRQVERKVRLLGLSMLWIFLVTLSVFPSITSTILSVNSDSPANSGLISRLRVPELFTPLVFVIFAIGDWMGRILPQLEWLLFKDWKLLMSCSLGRTIFIPLFLLCNITTPDLNVKPLINSDTAFIVIMFFFALSNGYFSTLIMLAAIVEPALESDEIDIAATCLAFYLTSGLALGSFISFPVRAAICHCNPFV